MADGVAVYCLVRPRTMPVEMCCRGETRSIRPREGALLFTIEPSAINSIGRRPLDFSVDVIPMRELDVRLPRAEAALLRPLDDCNDAFALANRYREFMKAQAASAKPDAVALMSGHLLDLIALALRPVTASALGESVMSSIKAGRLAQALADIDARLTHQGLTLGAVAEAQGISARYLQMLLDEAGLTFSSYVMNCRLAKAHAMLTDPARSQLTVATISAHCGFADPTHFSHAFKRRYGCTPRTARADAVAATISRDAKPIQ